MTTLLLVHGWGANARSWDAHAARWRDRHTVLVPDLPGHGGNGAADWTVERAGAFLARLAATADGPVVAVGHGLGGQLTTRLHTEHPRLIAAEVVIDPAYGRPDADFDEIAQRANGLEAHGADVLGEFMRGAFTPRTPEPVRRSVRAGLASTPVPVLVSYLRSQYITPAAIGLRSPARKALANRLHPTLALYSSRTAAAFERSASPLSEIMLWERHGHYLHREDPQRFVATVDAWLAHTFGL
jgi:pimeloyl-ACP methyl ester carboxylesterase